MNILRIATGTNTVPKIFYTNTANEYWRSSSSLIHTSLDGRSDAALSPDTRIYFLTGCQHGSAPWPPKKSPDLLYSGNTLDYRPVMRALLDAGLPVDLVVSRAARLTILDETGAPMRDAHWQDDLGKWLGIDVGDADIAYWPAGDLAAGPSSGSYPARGMIVVPASTAACAGIAIGLSKDLLQRAAEVNLKERRPVVVVPRETPVSRSHLEHLIALVDAGVIVLPASPGFYASGASASAAQLVDFVAGKVLDAVGVPHALFTRWSGGIGRR
jgi:4-hydroxy-3-polyprenylbenzoate decarboxylase